MIGVTEEAREYIRRLLGDAGTGNGGLRITAGDDEGGELTCELQVVDHPESSDVVVQTHGVRLFLDSRAAGALDDAKLIVEQGDLALAMPEAAGT